MIRHGSPQGRFISVGVLALAPMVAAAAPDPPSNRYPAPGAVDAPANPTLCVDVSHPLGGTLDVEFFGRDLAAEPGEDWEMIVIPDSQYYSQMYSSIFRAQTDWIVENREQRNIAFVSHVGDIVQLGSIPHEWEHAVGAMSLLENPATTELPEGIPYGLAVGNHDQAPCCSPGTLFDPGETTVLFNESFGISRFEQSSWYGGSWGDNNDNSYQLFEAGGMKFIAINLEFDEDPLEQDLQDAVLDWADQLLDAYSDRRAILASHAILCNGVNCPPTLWAPFSDQGQVIYDRLKHHKNLFLMLCGHAAVSPMQPRRSDTFDGHTIHTTLQNYQRWEDCPYWCGNGWLRIYTFRPSEDRIDATTYSPWLDMFRNDDCLDGSSCHEFDLPYDMEGGIQFEKIGSVEGVESGMTACTSWPGRTDTGQYEWYVKVSDGSETVTGERWTFASNGSCTLDSDCDDGDPCTVRSCLEGFCTDEAAATCCETAADCDDGNYCTDDTCSAGLCEHMDNVNACSDDDPCTGDDVCLGGTCVGTPIVCDDENGCTVDTCIDGECVGQYAPVPACCAADWECNDSNQCTADTCDGGNCVNALVANCCSTVADCPDDGDLCTVEACPMWNEGAYQLDGDDHITMHQAPGLGLAEFTIECWFKWDGNGSPVKTYDWLWSNLDVGGINAYPLVTKGFADQEHGGVDNWVQDVLSVNYFFGVAAPDAEHPLPVLAADFEEHTSGSGEIGINHPVFGVTPITLDEWHHAAVTYDGSCWQLYLDGQPETDGSNCPAEPPAYENKLQFAIGTALDINGGYLAHLQEGDVEGRFSGFIDEVRLWDHARTANEIAASMDRAIAAAPGLVSRWGLDGLVQGSDFLTEDSAGNHPGVVVRGTFTKTDFVDLGGGVCEATIVLPFEVDGLVVDDSATTSVSWQDQGAGTTYDLASGLLSDLRADGGVVQAQCLANDQATSSFEDDRPPPAAGDGYYFIVRAQTMCGAGSYGFASNGTERTPLAACP